MLPLYTLCLLGWVDTSSVLAQTTRLLKLLYVCTLYKDSWHTSCLWQAFIPSCWVSHICNSLRPHQDQAVPGVKRDLHFSFLLYRSIKIPKNCIIIFTTVSDMYKTNSKQIHSRGRP